MEHVELRILTRQKIVLGGARGSDEFCAVNAALVRVDYSGDDPVETILGTIHGHKIQAENFDRLTLDEVDSDTSLIGSMVCSMMEDTDASYENFLVIDRLRIKPKFRNKGYGFKLVKGLVEALTSTNDLVACIPGLIDDEAKLPKEEKKKRLSKLKKWWRKVGFKPIVTETSKGEVFAFEAELLMTFKNRAPRGKFTSFLFGIPEVAS